MKRIGLLFFIILMGCGNRQNKTVISGSIAHGEKEYIRLYKLGLEKYILIDSAKINKKSRFTFRIKQKEPSFYFLSTQDKNYATLLLEPGEKVIFDANYWDLKGSYDVLGSPNSELIRSLDIQLFITQKKIDSLLLIYEANKDSEHLNKILVEIDSIYLKVLEPGV